MSYSELFSSKWSQYPHSSIWSNPDTWSWTPLSHLFCCLHSNIAKLWWFKIRREDSTQWNSESDNYFNFLLCCFHSPYIYYSMGPIFWGFLPILISLFIFLWYFLIYIINAFVYIICGPRCRDAIRLFLRDLKNFTISSRASQKENTSDFPMGKISECNQYSIW